METQRLIEAHFPVIEISVASVKEKRVKANHPSAIHLWPGRRPLVACRAGILSTHLVAPRDPVHLQELVDSISRSAPHPQCLGKMGLLSPRTDVCRFLDPFGGGGAFALEAARAGFDVVTNDLNPVAYLIQRATVEFPALLARETRSLPNSMRPGELWEHVDFWGRWVLAQAKTELPNLYSMKGALSPSYFWWSWQMDCPQCGLRFPLLKTTAALKGAKSAMVIVLMHEERGNSCSVKYVKADPKFKDCGTFDLKGAHCPRCKAITSREAVQSIGRRKELTRRLLGIIWRGASGFQVSPPDTEAQHQAEQLNSAIQTCFQEIPFGLPKETITSDSDSMRVPIYGFTDYSQLFLPRQMLAIGTIVKQTRRALHLLNSHGYPPQWRKAIGVSLAMVVGRLVERNSQLCLWQPKKTCVSSVYVRYAMPFCADFVEANILGDRSGSYGTQLWKVVQAMRALCASFAVRENKAGVQCLNGDVAQGFEGKFDLIAADPPYYDSLSYSNLSDYFYVWIRRTL